MKFVGEVFTDYTQTEADIYFKLALKYIGDMTIWKDHKTDINLQVKRFLKSDAAKLLPDKAKEIEDIIQAVVMGISVDPKRLFTADDRAELLAKAERDGDKAQCAICGKFFLPDELVADHVEPWSRGGRTEVSNGQVLCRPCNSKRKQLLALRKFGRGSSQPG